MLEPLLLAFAQDPEDAAPRLILADWLEENGERLARLLRRPGHLWALDLLSRYDVGSVLYWRREPRGRARRLLRLGELAGWRPDREQGKKYPAVYVPGRGWRLGWYAALEAPNRLINCFAIGNAIKAAEVKYLRRQSNKPLFAPIEYLSPPSR